MQFSKANDGYTAETVLTIKLRVYVSTRLLATGVRDYHFKFLFYNQVMDKPSHCWYINLSVSDSSSGDTWA